MEENKLTIDYMLRSTWQAVAKMYNEQAGKYGESMSIGFTLLSIDPEEGSPSTTLGPRMGVESTSLSRTLKNMEAKGLITRKPNPMDGRSVLICLTEEGKEKREASKFGVLKFNEVVHESLSPQKIKHFYEVTEKINELIKANKIYKSEE
ncbi:MAG: MarR family transcriptional regulator [Flavobacteriales bacterium]|nr:MarR family transcriptional regulator [Flavobacteriales bacterium]